MSMANKIQLEILNALTFTEPFETLVEEVKASEPVIAAELKDLIDQRMVQVYEDQEDGTVQKSFYYDSDNMRLFKYGATSKGLDELEFK